MSNHNQKEIKTSISFKPVPELKKIRITYSFTTLTKKEENGLLCYIPGFDIHFFAPNDEERKKIGAAMTKSFFDFWIKDQGQKSLLLHLNKCGFRTENHNFAMQKLLNNSKISKTKFRLLRDSIPSEFQTAQKFNEEAEFAVAV